MSNFQRKTKNFRMESGEMDAIERFHIIADYREPDNFHGMLIDNIKVWANPR